MENNDKKLITTKKQRNILVVVILLLILASSIFLNHYNNVKTQLKMSDQNNKALADSVRVGNAKNGDLIYSKNVLISDKRNLKNLNTKLSDELKNYEGRISELNRIIANIQSDTVYLETELIKYVGYDKNTFGLGWEYDTIYSLNNSRYISGVSKFQVDTNGVITPLNTIISKDILNFSLTTGLREKDGNIEIFASSPYPNLIISELYGAIIDPNKHPVIKKLTKPKRFGIGPYVGVGLGVNTIPNANIGLGFQVGVGLQYNIIRF